MIITRKLAKTLMKHVNDYKMRCEKYEDLMEEKAGADPSTFKVAPMKIYLNVRKLREDGKMPRNAAPLKALLDKIHDRDPLTLKQYLMDQGKEESIVDELLDKLAESAEDLIEEAEEEEENNEDDENDENMLGAED